MSRQNNPVNEVGTFTSSNSWSGIPENEYVHGLLSGGVWGDNDPDNGYVTDLSYYLFNHENLDYDQTGYGNGGTVFAHEWHQYELRILQETMSAFEEVANISFTETNDYRTANVSWALLKNEDLRGSLGSAYLPLSEREEFAGNIAINFDRYSTSTMEADGVLDPGSYFYLTFTHELGHSLGLAHPHGSNNYYGTFPGVDSSSDGGDNGLNASPYTVMTYNDAGANSYVPNSSSHFGFSTSLGAFDIAAIQYLYGANESTNSGDDIYDLTTSLNGYQCIWDVGGEDTIDATNASAATTIDLRNATLNNETGGGGFVSRIDSYYGGYTIAYETNSNSISCIIENATGSNYDDVITGNSSANTLLGGSGDDTISAGLGNDFVSGGAGADTLVGNAGNDMLNGGSGIDTMLGGIGNDIYVVDNYSDIVEESYNQGTDTVHSSVTFILSSNLENLTLTGSSHINGVGNSSTNTIRGNSGANRLYGGAGVDLLVGNASNDILYGGSGIDTMLGGTGNDIYFVDSRSDIVREASNQGTDTVHSSVTFILSSNVENLTLTGSSHINGTGNSSANYIRGNSGANRLYGGSGADLLVGNAGNDVLYGGSGNDRLVGGDGIDRLIGGIGNDTLTGGSGNDIFLINTGSGRAVITDYTSGEDRIGLLGESEDDLTFSYAGGHTRISDDKGDLLAIVQNTIAPDITFV